MYTLCLLLNLMPIPILDGGHIFWALAEKVRGRPIAFSVMERAGFVGFALVIALFMIGQPPGSGTSIPAAPSTS